MKKLICTLGVVLFLVSCSNDDAQDVVESIIPVDESSILPKRIVDTYENGTIETTIVTYTGNKIERIADVSGSIVFTYVGNKITKQDFVTIGGVIEQINTFEYDAQGKLSVFRRLEENDNLGYKELYTYNANNTISIAQFYGDYETQTIPGGSATITFTDGEVTRIQNEEGNEHNYAYDNRNNPSKNIIGMAEISFVEGEASGILHNITLDETPFDGDSVTSYEYNTSNFPKRSTENFDGQITITEYFYE